MRKGLTVSFNERVKLDHFDKIEEFERILIWWGPADYARFRATCTKTVQHDLGTEDHTDGDSFFCLRGLESWGMKGSKERRARIKAAVNVVLDCQQNLREEYGICDGFAMAKIYEQETHQDLVQARMRGAQDEEEQQLEQKKGFKAYLLPSARIKRRRSSEGKLKNQSLGMSLQNFARKITSFPAA